MRGRFAPSPTGALHLGNARTALVAWLSARSQGGHFILRVEDLDRPRVVAGAEQGILDDLRWMGLDWDEGPDTGGSHGPYRQSERHEHYLEALERLAAAGLLFACRCSRAELRRIASAPHPGEEGPAYPGRCRGTPLPPDWRQPMRSGPALRFRVDPGLTCFDDLLHGRTCQQVARAVGDFVVRRADGVVAYQLAVVVDDLAMGVTEVVRGADLLGSTPRQILLARALGAEPPSFGHLPLVLGPDGQRLGKRHGSVSLAELRAAGVRPARLVGWLGHSLGLLDRPEPCAPVELVAAFAWHRLDRRPLAIDPAQVITRLLAGRV